MSIALTGVIGDPVSHSLSPFLHHAAFEHLGIAARYERWQTSSAALPARVASLRAPHVLGANVTLPHKIAVVRLLDRLDPLAAQIGAVNTIVRLPDGQLEGCNTDAPATIATLREDAGVDPAGRRVVILGASGAARAAAFALIGARASMLTVINRTLERAEELLADVLASRDDDPYLRALALDDPDVPDAIRAADVIINATSLGWHRDETPLPGYLIPATALVFDMVYQPTRLLREAAQAGASTLDGRGMLVRQAALSFERWTGAPAPLDVMFAAFDQARSMAA
ncbi:shikimate dehydrogenase [Roseiflexus castenholzii]|uniref:Shikimate dehydrogenase (NADP(+)) n=1 Tax=Roseiflexus castenholzii (strain DSM 13941 / HLO8) TaxID=383372 RepID=A7NPG9_ROSCS|nr:shikimate dehydrogenase [Roseiflexus castenholzii]ABU59465.1 shikimate 5-dehydrogenase [Roseiflexus castenholzii DSM 13941]